MLARKLLNWGWEKDVLMLLSDGQRRWPLACREAGCPQFPPDTSKPTRVHTYSASTPPIQIPSHPWHQQPAFAVSPKYKQLLRCTQREKYQWSPFHVTNFLPATPWKSLRCLFPIVFTLKRNTAEWASDSIIWIQCTSPLAAPWSQVSSSLAQYLPLQIEMNGVHRLEAFWEINEIAHKWSRIC